MTTHEERIHHMIESGQVSPEEGTDLLRALDQPEAEPRLRDRLLDPIEHLSTGSALGVSALVCAISLGVALAMNVRFDGALDMHVVSAGGVTAKVALLDQLVAWPLTAALGYAAARLAGGKPRPVDMLVAVGVARAPLVVMALVAAAAMPDIPADATLQTVIETLGTGPGLVGTMVVAIVSIPLVVYLFTLLLRGYRTATGLTGARAWVSAGAWLLVAEIASKAILYAAAA